jgi:hypothetical protein
MARSTHHKQLGHLHFQWTCSTHVHLYPINPTEIRTETVSNILKLTATSVWEDFYESTNTRSRLQRKLLHSSLALSNEQEKPSKFQFTFPEIIRISMNNHCTTNNWVCTAQRNLHNNGFQRIMIQKFKRCGINFCTKKSQCHLSLIVISWA